MDAILAPFKGDFKIKKRKLLDIDNVVFKLHYRVTMAILVLFTAIMSSSELIGEKLKCTHSDPTDSRKQLEHVINTYCFYLNTFVVPKNYNTSLDGDATYTGVGPHKPDDETVENAYYQWVPYVLGLQALAFYIPHLIWRTMENGILSKIVNQIRCTDELLTSAKRKEKVDEAISIFPKIIPHHRSWHYWHVFCEVLNLLNVVVQVLLTDRFLGGRFWDLGLQVYEHSGSHDYNALNVIFPKVAKCTFQKYGPGGSMQKHDAICVLSLNIIYEKAYLVLWWWYLILFIASALTIIHRILSRLLYNTNIKYNLFLFNIQMFNKPKSATMLKLFQNAPYHDWFFLQHVATNVNGPDGLHLLEAVAEQYDESSSEMSYNMMASDSKKTRSGLPEPTFIHEDPGYANRETIMLNRAYSGRETSDL